MEGPNRLLFVILISFFVSINACQEQTGISFPLRYLDYSIDRGISNEELNVPTGRCENTPYRRCDISLILPRICAPRTLYSGFIDSNRVTCLSLRESRIERVSYGSFDRMSNLFYLDLSKNRIQFCDLLSFGGHPSLSTLILDENVINGTNSYRHLTINQADYFPNLEHLYLRKNRIAQFSISIRRNFPKLSHLYLTDNLLTSASLNYMTDLPITLSHLHLERNRITTQLESRILRELRYLYLDGNEITSLCSSASGDSCFSLRSATKLKFLSLSRNKIVNIAYDTFVNTWDLRSLYLAHNQLEIIENNTFDRLRELADLSLSYNRLENVPNLRQLTMITSLMIDHNFIDRIFPHTFYSLERLKWLSLSNNRLRMIDSHAFVNLPELEELDLSENHLDQLSYMWIDNQTHLRLLDLRANIFTTYDYLNIRDQTSLTDLYLQGNPVVMYRDVHRPIYRRKFSRNVTIHSEYDMATYETKPCYTFCNFNNRLTRLYDYRV